MADVYQFSQSSSELLERCVAAASQSSAKWIKLFRQSTKEMVIKQENVFVHVDNDHTILISLKSDASDEVVKDSEEQQTKQSNLDEVKAIERMVAILETAPSNKLGYLTTQCGYGSLLSAVAENLTTQCIQRICEDVLDSPDIQNEEVLLHFFPVYIKRETCCVILNLLVRGYKTCPDKVLVLIESLFMNTDIPNRLLEEFFISVDKKAHPQFLGVISVKDLPINVFIHHLKTITFLYKSCHKTLEIHNFVLNALLQSAQFCQNDKNYGRCLLTFFQGLNENNYQINKQTLEQLLLYHKTPFIKLCRAILKPLN